MALIIADSDVLIDALRGKEPSLSRVKALIASATLATTQVSRFELLSGPRDVTERVGVERLLAPMPVLPLDAEGAENAAEIRRFLQARGAGIGTADYLVAGIVLAYDGRLLTKNRRHFGRVPGLALEELE